MWHRWLSRILVFTKSSHIFYEIACVDITLWKYCHHWRSFWTSWLGDGVTRRTLVKGNGVGSLCLTQSTFVEFTSHYFVSYVFLFTRMLIHLVLISWDIFFFMLTLTIYFELCWYRSLYNKLDFSQSLNKLNQINWWLPLG